MKEDQKGVETMGKKRKAYSGNDIWGNANFKTDACGEKRSLIGKIKYFKECVTWSYQRIRRGYCDYDMWFMYEYLDAVLPKMLKNLSDSNKIGLNREGWPGHPIYDDDDPKEVKAEIERFHARCVEKDRIYGRMLHLWKEQSYGRIQEDPVLRENFGSNTEYRQWCRDEFFSMMSEHYYDLKDW